MKVFKEVKMNPTVTIKIEMSLADLSSLVVVLKRGIEARDWDGHAETARVFLRSCE